LFHGGKGKKIKWNEQGKEEKKPPSLSKEEGRLFHFLTI